MRLIAVFALLLLAVSAVPVLAEPPPPENVQVTLPPTPEDLDPSMVPGTEQIVAGLEKAEATQKERQQWLEGSEAEQQRQSSRLAYADLSPAQSEALLRSTFAELLANLNSDPARFLSDAQLVRPTQDETAATVKDEGDGMLMDSDIPVRTEDDDGDLRKVDLSLEATAEGFETTNALSDVVIPDSAAAPVEVGEEGIGISLVGADGNRVPRLMGDENTFAPEVLPDTDMLVSPIAAGVEIFNLLRSEQSPEAFRFEVEMPAGAELRAADGWGAEVVKDGEEIATIPEPIAVDAQGTKVPVDLQIEGDSIVLTVEHRDGDYAMPILLDPILENGERWFEWQNFDALNNWAFNKNVAGMYGSTTCIYNCFYGSGHGLYVSAQSGSYWPEQWAQWAYGAPNIHSYVKDATLAPYNHFDHGCEEAQYPKPHNYFGIWSRHGYWVYLSVNSANQPGNSYTLPFAGDAVIFGLSSGGATYTIPCWRDLYAGGSHIWLDDWNPPWLEWVNGVPSGWVSDETQFSITARASDEGLGVQNITIYPQGTAQFDHELPQEQCSGTRRDLCVPTYTATFTNPGGRFLEGERPASLNAHDPTGKYTTSNYDFTMRVDKTPPDITLSGQLAEETSEVGSEEKPAGTGDRLSLNVYNLSIATRDGNPSPASAKRSGVKDIEVFLDGVEQEVPWEPQSCTINGCPETMNKTYKLIVSDLETAGKHQLEVVARDQVGKQLKRTIEFEYFPATGMKDEYVMHHFPLSEGQGEGSDGPELAVNVVNGNLVYRETDVDVQSTAGVDLELERYYNSMLPEADNTEWGDGWTLAQTPDLDPKAEESPVPNVAEIIDSSGAIEDDVALPTEAGAQKFDPSLQASLTKKSSGGYELSDETGEAEGTIAFDATGQAEALLTDGAAKVDYTYEGGELAEVEVEDPATFAADPKDLEIPKPQLITDPVYTSSFGTEGTEAGQFKSPGDIAVATDGNLWVVDTANNRIQKLAPNGQVHMQFGSYGTGNGQFNRPTAVTVQSNGRLLITDSGNSRMQIFNANGVFVSKLGSQGTGNGQFTAPGPEGIALDASNNFWIADTYRGRVQKFNSFGQVVKIAGTKGSGAGQLGEPAGIDVDPSGNLWVADRQNHRISVFSSNGVFLNQYGSQGTGDGQFQSPSEVEIDAAGNVWVGDQGNNRIQRFDLSGQFKGKFGSAGSGPGQLSLGYPMGIAVDGSHLWLTDVKNHRVQEWALPIEKPTYASSFGSWGSGNGKLELPSDVGVDMGDNLWVLDKGNDRIQKFDPNGQYLSQIGKRGTGDGEFRWPASIDFDRDGYFYVADTGNDRIQKFGPEGQFMLKFGSQGQAQGQFATPEGVAVDEDGDVWVADGGNSRIQKFSPNGEFLMAFGTYGTGSGQLVKPTGIDIDPDGNVWVADYQNNRVLVFSEAGQFIKQFGSLGTGNGQFRQPDEIDIDPDGNVWVGEQKNYRVQRFDLSGQYLGQFGSYGGGDGQFAFAFPVGLDVDRWGRVWIADAGNHRVQKWLLRDYLPADPPVLDLADGDPKVEVETDDGLVSSVTGNAAGEHIYEHDGDDLVSHESPEGEIAYEYDEAGRMIKVTLPDGTWAEIGYGAFDRVKSVAVAPEGTNQKTTRFEYTDEPRRTFVEIPGAPNVTYDIGGDGSVLKWWYQQQAPQFLSISGSLWEEKEKEIAIGDHTLSVVADSTEGIASIQFIADGKWLLDEKTCAQDLEKLGTECVKLENGWATSTADLTPGILNLEVITTDSDGLVESERFWVDVPYTPPPPSGVPAPPSFNEIADFREKYGLEIVFPVANESELEERIFDLLHAWHSPNTPAGQVARASWERWGVPLRPADVAELEYRESYIARNGPLISDWGTQNHPESYAGYYVDHPAGGIIRIGFASPQQSVLVNQIQELPNLMASDRIKAFTSTPSHSLAILHDQQMAISNYRVSHPSVLTLIVRNGVDIPSNKVSVGATNTSGVSSALTGAFGSQAPISVYSSPPNDLVPRAGRWRDSEQIRAGDALQSEYMHDCEDGGAYECATTCTAAFGAVDDVSTKPNGQLINAPFVVTAGHCFEPGETVYRSKDGENLKEIGKVSRSALLYRNSGFESDFEAIRVKNPNLVPRWIYLSSMSSQKFGPARFPDIGKTICLSGKESNRVSCGPVLGPPEEAYYVSAERGVTGIMWLVPARAYSIEGDSGSPIWDAYRGDALGVLSGGLNSNPNYTTIQPLTPWVGHENEAPGGLNAPEVQPLRVLCWNGPPC